MRPMLVAYASRRCILALCAIGLAPLVGCHATKVIEIASADNGGIPFFPLIAANQEVRTYAQTWLKVDVQLREAVPSTKEGKTEWKDDAMTTSFFAYARAGQSADDAAKGVRKTIDAKTQSLGQRPTLDDVQPVLATLVSENHLVEPIPWKTPKEVDGGGIVTADQRTLTQVPATGRQFLNIWAPYGGSASADVKLDSRGVLSEASAQRQDQMPPAAAGAIGAIVAGALTGGGTALGGALGGVASLTEGREYTDLQRPGHTASQPNTPADEHAIVITGISVTITPVRRLYTVTAIWPLAAGFEKQPGAFTDGQKSPCFTASGFDDYTSGCLVSVATAMDGPVAPAPASAK